MIVGIGLDLVEIERFERWTTWSFARLNRFFSTEEIHYIMSSPTRVKARFASRFGAREAMLKALQQAVPTKQLSLLQVAKNISVIPASKGGVTVFCNHHFLRALGLDPDRIKTHMVVSDTQTIAVVMVIIEYGVDLVDSVL